MNYYNEWDKGAAAWLRELIKAGLIPNGYVDDRSITDVTPSDLEGFTQCHFFAGIGGWSYALQLAGIPASVRLWTGSPPCQPFSVAGKQLGQLDERHLAPTFMRLVAQCRPPVLFGEQVAAAIGKHWLDDLFAELEGEGYACGAAVLPACSVGAPHKRDRLFFGAVGDANCERHYGVDALLREDERQRREGVILETSRSSEFGCMADTNDTRSQGRGGVSECADQQSAGASGVVDRMGQPDSEIFRGEPGASDRAEAKSGDWEYRYVAGASGILPQESGSTSPHHSFWADADWLACRDGKFRPVESGTFPLANGIPARVGRLRGYGNAIVPQVAAEFIKAFCAAEKDTQKPAKRVRRSQQ